MSAYKSAKINGLGGIISYGVIMAYQQRASKRGGMAPGISWHSVASQRYKTKHQQNAGGGMAANVSMA
jgi:hypothetical protein